MQHIDPLEYLDDVDDDKYVSMLYDYITNNIDDIALLPVNNLYYILLSYSIVRLVVPDRWRIYKKRDADEYGLWGTDHYVEFIHGDLVQVCNADDMVGTLMHNAYQHIRDNAREYAQTLGDEEYTDEVYDDMIKYKPTIDPLRQGILHKLIMNYRYNGQTDMVHALIEAIEDGDINIVRVLPLSDYMRPSAEASIQLSYEYRMMNNILKDIPPSGCGNMFSGIPSSYRNMLIL